MISKEYINTLVMQTLKKGTGVSSHDHIYAGLITTLFEHNEPLSQAVTSASSSGGITPLISDTIKLFDRLRGIVPVQGVYLTTIYIKKPYDLQYVYEKNKTDPDIADIVTRRGHSKFAPFQSYAGLVDTILQTPQVKENLGSIFTYDDCKCAHEAANKPVKKQKYKGIPVLGRTVFSIRRAGAP